MKHFDTSNNRAKDKIKSAWDEGDFWGIFCAGIDNFMGLLFSDIPISAHRFLEDTGDLFDKYIIEVSERENLRYFGGKMTLKLEQTQSDRTGTILLIAELYFQTQEKKWIVKQKSGKMSTAQISDWDNSIELNTLRQEGKMELAIDPPGYKEA